MTPEDHNTNAHEAGDAVDRDLLISRVVDDAASARDWDQLRSLAEYDASVWRELFEAQRAQAELAQAVQQAIAIADEIDAPVSDLPRASWRFRFRQAASWGGWAVAASVAILWVAPNVTGPGANTGTSTGTGAGASEMIAAGGGVQAEGGPSLADAARKLDSQSFGALAERPSFMLDNLRTASTDSSRDVTAAADPVGEHVGEMPDRVLLEVRELPNGQLELIYVRQLIERAVVDEGDLYQVKPDDAGIERTVPYRSRRPSSGPI